MFAKRPIVCSSVGSQEKGEATFHLDDYQLHCGPIIRETETEFVHPLTDNAIPLQLHSKLLVMCLLLGCTDEVEEVQNECIQALEVLDSQIAQRQSVHLFSFLILYTLRPITLSF